MYLWSVAKREMRLGFRNPWSYSFLALFSFFTLALLVIQSQVQITGYTSTTGTMLNLILYLVPLLTLLLGSFSVTAEKEDGNWRLLSTYALSSSSFLWGKYIGLCGVLVSIVSFGYGLAGVIGALIGKAFTSDMLLLFFVFTVCLVLLFLGLAILIGSLSKNRWQALTIGVGVWFLLILGWQTLLISTLSIAPYLWIKPILVMVTFLNPAELIRLFMVVKLGGGSVLGPEYYQWVEWIKAPMGTPVFLLVCVSWIGVYVGSSILRWERSRYRDE
ncbi:ABC transporter permease [Brevibacillus ginsengisoli]|uniref:ABC transporter permease n=1 Tax=Brevibacillus ginsengisoli TaxID=363854 RepID=UPI003CF2655B